MIIELENKSMTNLIFLETVDIKTKKPNIEDEYGYSSPSWEITRKC